MQIKWTAGTIIVAAVIGYVVYQTLAGKKGGSATAAAGAAAGAGGALGVMDPAAAAAAAAIAAAQAASSAPSAGSGDPSGSLLGSNIPFGPAPDPTASPSQDGPTLPDGTYYLGVPRLQNYFPVFPQSTMNT